MPDRDAFAERGRALEEEYFRKKDQELIERMRKAARDEESRHEMGKKTGLNDPALLEELQALGFTPDTVSLLPLVPVVQVAWAEGGVSPAERALLLRLARARGIDEGSAADRQLSEWLASPPAPEVVANATRLIRAMLATPTSEPSSLTADDLVRFCETIASASGGVFGIINRVSAEERALLAKIATDLRQKTP